jgi:hypothetical protein
MNQHKTYLCFFITLLTLAACQDEIQVSPEIQQPESRIIETRYPQESPIVETSPSISANTPSAVLADTCLGYQELSYINGISGVIGFVLPIDLQPDLTNQWVLVGGNPLQQESILEGENTGAIGFSPDEKWFAYQKFPDDLPGSVPIPNLYLLSAEGEEIITPIPVKPEETNGNWGSKWLANELMMFQYFSSSHPRDSWLFGRYIIFNPFTGERYDEMLANLPYWSNNTTVYFSPDMTRVVYVSDAQSEIGTSIVLWDVNLQKLLWYKQAAPTVGFDEQFMGFRGFNQIVIWSPDNSNFVFTVWEKLQLDQIEYKTYIVDRNGTQENILVSALHQEGDVIQGGLWSPDSRFIYYINPWSEQFFLYDVEANQKIELCIQAWQSVAWSPDSNYLAYTEKIQERLHLLILDIYSGELKDIGQIQAFDIYGWIENESWLENP